MSTEVIVAIVGIVVAAIIAFVAAIVGPWVWERKIRDRIRVRRVVNQADPNAIGLIDLYSKLFPDASTNYSEDDILEMLEQQDLPVDERPVRVEDFILVALFQKSVVGFSLCHYYPDRKKAIISYYGIDKESANARQHAAVCLLGYLQRELTIRGCKYLFFDVERPSPNLPKRELAERLSRIRRFKQSAKSFRLNAYSLDIDYRSPRITLAAGTRSAPLTLLVIPIAQQMSTTLSKATVMEFLRFIYLDCYGDIYDLKDSRYAPYHAHLTKSLLQFQKTLPDVVHLS